MSRRMLILPQPSFALPAVVSQVLDSKPVDSDTPVMMEAAQGFDLKNKQDREKQ